MTLCKQVGSGMQADERKRQRLSGSVQGAKWSIGDNRWLRTTASVGTSVAFHPH